MTAERVEAAVEDIRRQDPALGQWADVAADGLTTGEGEEVLSQAAIQDFLWYRLPARYPDEAWLPVVRATVALMEGLGLQRYALIAGSKTTTSILDGWREGPGRGFAAYRAAANASGVKPPGTELLGWGSIMGFEEASAYAAVEARLEAAIVSGQLAPGASGWRARAAAVCDRFLWEAAPHAPDRSWLSLVTSERIRTWIETGYPERLRAWRAAAAERFQVVPEPPDDLDPVIGPMRWLLWTCREGVTLTQSGYLPPAIVHRAIERFAWWEWPGRPRSEADVHQIVALRETAARLRLLTKRGRRLTTSRSGTRFLDDGAGLWRAVAAGLGGGDEYSGMLSELIAHRLLEGAAMDDALAEAIVPVIGRQGWQSGGEPLDGQHIAWSIHRPLYHWRLFGLLDEVRPRWEGNRPTGPNVTSLTPAGRATALAFLYTKATAPRTSLRA